MSFNYLHEDLLYYLLEVHPDSLLVADNGGRLPIHKLASHSTNLGKSYLFERAERGDNPFDMSRPQSRSESPIASRRGSIIVSRNNSRPASPGGLGRIGGTIGGIGVIGGLSDLRPKTRQFSLSRPSPGSLSPLSSRATSPSSATSGIGSLRPTLRLLTNTVSSTPLRYPVMKPTAHTVDYTDHRCLQAVPNHLGELNQQ